MNTPLGQAAGNWLEVKESVACLDGRGPADLLELVIDFAAHLLVQTKKVTSIEAARQEAKSCLASGEPRRKWDEMLLAQGADLAAFERKLALDHTAPVVVELKASRSGFMARCDARILGEVIRDLGGGRLTKTSVVNHDVGVDQIKKPGDPVQAGTVLARIHAADAAQAESARLRLLKAFVVEDAPPTVGDLVVKVIER
jgi:thymidine phosphorylase